MKNSRFPTSAAMASLGLALFGCAQGSFKAPVRMVGADTARPVPRAPAAAGAADKLIGPLIAVERTFPMNIEDCAERYGQFGNDMGSNNYSCEVFLLRSNDYLYETLIGAKRGDIQITADIKGEDSPFPRRFELKLTKYGYRISFQEAPLVRTNSANFETVRPLFERFYQRIDKAYTIWVYTIQR